MLINGLVDVVWIGLSQFVLVLSNFLLLKLLTNRLSVYEFGQYSLFMSIALFVRQVVYDPFSIVLAKECAYGESRSQRVLGRLHVMRVMVDRAGVIFVGFAVVAVFCSKITNSAHIYCLLAGLVAIYVCSNGAQGFYSNVLNSIMERKFVSAFSMADSFLKVLLVFLVFNYLKNTVVNSLASVAMGAMSVFLLFRWFLLERYETNLSSIRFDKKLINRVMVAGVPFVVSTILIALKNVGDRWVLTGFLGVKNLADYSVLLQLGYAPIVLVLGVGQTFVAPKIYSHCSSGGCDGYVALKRLLFKIVIAIFVVTFFVCLFTVLISGWFFGFLVGEKYRGLELYLPFFVISGAIASVGNILQIVIIGLFESRNASLFVVLSLVAGIFSGGFCVWKFGFIGSICGLALSNAFMVLVYLIALCFSVFRCNKA